MQKCTHTFLKDQWFHINKNNFWKTHHIHICKRNMIFSFLISSPTKHCIISFLIIDKLIPPLGKKLGYICHFRISIISIPLYQRNVLFLMIHLMVTYKTLVSWCVNLYSLCSYAQLSTWSTAWPPEGSNYISLTYLFYCAFCCSCNKDMAVDSLGVFSHFD
jgi:hypothetical protein